MRVAWTLALVPLLGLAVVPLGGTAAVGGGSPTVALLPVDQPADYQLGGAYPPPPSVGTVTNDRSDPASGTYSICYINAFQTQPGEARWWLTRHANLVLRVHGRPVADRNWSGEYLLDVSSPARRRAVSAIVGGWIDGCARAGYDAIEPDNLDSWTRSRKEISQTDAVAYARLLVDHAHDRGLAVAQKNAAALLPRRAAVGWDFAVVEECQVYQECARFERVYGPAMIEIEYSDAGGRANFSRACRARGDRIAVVYRDRDLVPVGRPGYVFDTC